MRGNQYNTQPKLKPSFGHGQPPKQSLASILEKYERDLCEEVFLKLGNDLPVLQVIQTQKQRKPMTATTSTVGRESTDRGLVWSKKYQGKQNTIFEQHMMGSTGISPISHGNPAPSDRFRKKSPINGRVEPLQPSNIQNNENLVFKAKQGKLGSLKDMLNDFPANKDFRESQTGPLRKQSSVATPAMPPRFTTPCSAPVQRKLETPQHRPKLMESVRVQAEEETPAELEPSVLIQDLGLEGLELCQDEMVKVADQMKHLQETLIGILGHAKIHPTQEMLQQIKQQVAAQVRQFARNLLSDRANSQKGSKVGANDSQSFLKNPPSDNDNKNHSLFFSFESPICPKQDMNVADDELNLPTLLPDNPEPTQHTVELEKSPQQHMVNNVPMITSKQMLTSNASEPSKQTESKMITSTSKLLPSIRLEGFDWLKPSEPRPSIAQEPAGLGFQVDLGLNNSSDLDLSRTINEQR